MAAFNAKNDALLDPLVSWRAHEMAEKLTFNKLEYEELTSLSILHIKYLKGYALPMRHGYESVVSIQKLVKRNDGVLGVYGELMRTSRDEISDLIHLTSYDSVQYAIVLIEPFSAQLLIKNGASVKITHMEIPCPIYHFRNLDVIAP